MKKDTLYDALREAERFARFARKALNLEQQKIGVYNYVPAGPDAAQVKRASMDLTRALARVRKTNDY